ncbi:MAG: glycosyltransferase family 4 protein [Oligoflexia bacterium]|nr:glycosyltransferase family 4 protein [Oligoflexia bacterium]
MSATLPRVVIDARMVGPIPHGFSRYIGNLAQGLARLAAMRALPYEPLFLIGRETPENIFARFGTVQAGAPFLSLRELAELPVLARRLGAALYHSPTFSSLLPGSLRCPWIVTVHDLNHLAYGGFAKRVYYRSVLRPFTRGAAALLTVSEFSRAELARWSGVAEDRIGIVSNALDESCANPPDEAERRRVLVGYGLEHGKYFFCLSNPKPHKNLALLFEAYGDYRAKAGVSHPAWPLAVVASGIPGPVPDGVRLLGALEDSETHALMAGAGAVVFPSLYEGFGLPPVEAAALGAPVIVSRIPPHQEGLAKLGSDEVLWVEPTARAAWAEALGRAAAGGLSRPSPESRARTLARFSIERMGRDMDRVYRRVLGIVP